MIVPRLEAATAEQRAAYRRRMRWRGLPWSVGMLLVSWPIPLLVGLVLYRLGELIGLWAACTLLVVWLGFSMSTLVRLSMTKTMDAVSDPRMPRRPTPEESAMLDLPWRTTLLALGVPDSTYALRVRDSQGSAGQAWPGGVVAVSAEAVRELSAVELEGLLGHEVGHFVGDGGSTWRRLSWWLSEPIRLPFKIGGRLAGRPAVLLIVQPCVFIGLVTLLVWLFGAVGALALLGAAAAQLLGRNAILRRNQSNADRVAVDLGAGRGLRLYFERRRSKEIRRWYRRSLQPWWLRVILAVSEASSRDPNIGRRVEAIGNRIRARERKHRVPQGGPPPHAVRRAYADPRRAWLRRFGSPSPGFVPDPRAARRFQAGALSGQTWKQHGPRSRPGGRGPHGRPPGPSRRNPTR
ncbi:hypothetical protein [Nocardia sp. NPDC020380]|uniref:hypothetical protein n=1 Tax=Nocardia sp. NPDC020380 TaxID=3364309 RepID=UPI003792C3F1